MNKHRCLDEVLDEMFYDRLTGTKFSSNIYPTNVQHKDQMLDEMLDTFDLSFTLLTIKFYFCLFRSANMVNNNFSCRHLS